MTSRLGETITENSRQCGFMAHPEAPRCPRNADVHIYVVVDGKEVSIPACGMHKASASAVGQVRGMHPFGPGCAHAVARWGLLECTPDV